MISPKKVTSCFVTTGQRLLQKEITQRLFDMRLIVCIGDIEHLLLHLHVTILAPLDHLMLFDTVVDLVHRVTGKTVASAVCHRIGISTVTADAGQHRFMPQVRLDVFLQGRMTGKAVPGTGKKRDSHNDKNSYKSFHAAIILLKSERFSTESKNRFS